MLIIINNSITILSMLRVSKHKRIILAIVYLCTAVVIILICLVRKDQLGLDPILWALLFPLAGFGFDLYMAYINFRTELHKTPIFCKFTNALLKAMFGIAMLILLFMPIDFASKGIISALGVKAPNTQVRLDKLDTVDENTLLEELKLPAAASKPQPYIESTYYRGTLILLMLIWAGLFFILDSISMSSKIKKTV